MLFYECSQHVSLPLSIVSESIALFHCDGDAISMISHFFNTCFSSNTSDFEGNSEKARLAEQVKFLRSKYRKKYDVCKLFKNIVSVSFLERKLQLLFSILQESCNYLFK
jgi:hypothetical protein